MGLDYTAGCVNFRDAGAFINLIAEKPLLKEKILYRGGSIDYVTEHKDIAYVQTIINLRKRADYEDFTTNYLHFPMENNVEKYDTTQKEVKRWLNNIIRTFENENLAYPILIHCLSGKDRTGILVAAILLICGIDKSYIMEEYFLSDGETHLDLMTMAVSGMENITSYFEQVNLEQVTRNLKANLLA